MFFVVVVVDASVMIASGVATDDDCGHQHEGTGSAVCVFAFVTFGVDSVLEDDTCRTTVSSTAMCKAGLVIPAVSWLKVEE